MLDKIFEFLHGDKITLILGCLFAVSEGLAQIPSLKSNSVLQAISNGLKWVKDKLAPKA